MTNRRVLSALVVAAAVVGGAACADQAPTAPAAAPLSLSKQNYDVDGDGHLSEAEKAAQKAAKELRDAEKKAEKEAWERQRKEWKEYKNAVKKGLVVAEFLRCEPLKRETARKLIGPQGGELKVGPHRLEIPAGALSAPVLISADTRGGPIVDVAFEPHGLQFSKPVTMTLSYKHCIFPVDPRLQVGYYEHLGNSLGNGTMQVIELPPFLQDEDLDEVQALTDHFSGYALVTRSGAASTGAQ